MTTSPAPATRLLHWAARLGGLAAIVPLMLIVVGESGTGPDGVREWLYLALFPFGFSAGYLLGWLRPLLGGVLSLACMAASLALIGRGVDTQAYLVWGVLCIPAVLFVATGLLQRRAAHA
ncbi:MAG: hypothetical protein R3B35_15235 [Gemmatimonadales bacterium]